MRLQRLGFGSDGRRNPEADGLRWIGVRIDLHARLLDESQLPFRLAQSGDRELPAAQATKLLVLRLDKEFVAADEVTEHPAGFSVEETGPQDVHVDQTSG